MGRCIRFAFALLLVSSGASMAQEVVEPPDVYRMTQFMHGEIELIRVAMEKPLAEPLPAAISSASPREVYFQAVTLRNKAERLCQQFAFPSALTPSTLSVRRHNEIKSADVLAIVSEVLTQIKCAMWDLRVTGKTAMPDRDPSKTPTDVYKSIVQANRQLSLLLDDRFNSNEVYAAVELANTHVTTLLDEMAPIWRTSESDPPIKVDGKDSIDVYRSLYDSYGVIDSIAKRSGLSVLVLGPEFNDDRTPSAAFDLGTLIVSELQYLSTFSDVELQGRYLLGRNKKISDVYQQAEILQQNLKHLDRLLAAFPNWVPAPVEPEIVVAEESAVDVLAGMALDAASELAAERGLAFAGLYNPKAASSRVIATIANHRKVFNAKLNDLLTVSKESGADVTTTASLFENLEDARESVDEALIVPLNQRSRLAAPEWFQTATAVLDNLTELARPASEVSGSRHKRALRKIALTALSMSEAAGQERAIIGAVISSGQALPTELSWQLELARFQVDSEWESTKLLLRDIKNEPLLASAADKVESLYFGQLREVTEDRKSALAGRSTLGLTEEQWFEIANAAIGAMVELGLQADQLAATRD